MEMNLPLTYLVIPLIVVLNVTWLRFLKGAFLSIIAFDHVHQRFQLFQQDGTCNFPITKETAKTITTLSLVKIILN
jgi:hypothetical protein